MIEFFQYAFVGKLFLYLVRKFPLTGIILGKGKLSTELYNCDLCLGFWVYLALAPFFKIKIDTVDNKFVRNFVLAGVTSFLMFLISSGWRENFENLVIVDDTRTF